MGFNSGFKGLMLHYTNMACLVIFSVWQIIILIIHHELDLDRPVAVLSNSLRKGLPSHLRPFGLKFSIIFGILLLFILVICRHQFHLYFLSFSSNGTTFKSSKISLLLIITINNKDWTLWSVPSPELQLLSPTSSRSSNCSPSLRSVVIWFQRVSV